MKFLILLLTISLSLNAMAKSFTFEQLCEKQVERTLDEYNNDDDYSYSNSSIKLLDKVIVDETVVAEYAITTKLDGPYQGTARSDYSITYSLINGVCTIETPIIIKEYDIED